MSDQFTDPTPQRALPRGNGGQESDLKTGRKNSRPHAPKFDQWRRYLLPDPDTGRMRAWTRASTVAKTIEDTFHLQRWEVRKVMKGLTLRPDLYAMVQTLDPDDESDKGKLNQIGKEAKEAAGGSYGANMGTAFHAFTEDRDMGRYQVPADPGLDASLRAYQACLEEYGWDVVPELLERVVVVPDLGVAGRIDKILIPRNGGGLPMIGDLKTQKTMDFGALAQSIQLAIYSRGAALWDEERGEYEAMPSVDQLMGVVLWAPVIEPGTCEPWGVNLERGWYWAKHSMETRKGRNEKGLTYQLPKPARVVREDIVDAVVLDEDYWAEHFTGAGSVDDLMELGRAALVSLGLERLPDRLRTIGQERRKEIES